MLCSRVLPKPKPGSTAMRFRAMPAASAAATRSPRNSATSGDDIVIVRGVLHGARITLHVHQAYPGLAGGDQFQGARRPQGIDVVDHVGAGGQRGAHHFGLDGIDRQRHTAVAQWPRSPAAGGRFPVAPIPGRTRSRGLGAEIEDLRALFDEPPALRDGGSISPRRPSPEKESSDRLTMPMISGRSAFSTKRPQ
jgi:hypothetical protein